MISRLTLREADGRRPARAPLLNLHCEALRFNGLIQSAQFKRSRDMARDCDNAESGEGLDAHGDICPVELSPITS